MAACIRNPSLRFTLKQLSSMFPLSAKVVQQKIQPVSQRNKEMKQMAVYKDQVEIDWSAQSRTHGEGKYENRGVWNLFCVKLFDQSSTGFYTCIYNQLQLCEDGGGCESGPHLQNWEEFSGRLPQSLRGCTGLWTEWFSLGFTDKMWQKSGFSFDSQKRQSTKKIHINETIYAWIQACFLCTWLSVEWILNISFTKGNRCK